MRLAHQLTQFLDRKCLQLRLFTQVIERNRRKFSHDFLWTHACLCRQNRSLPRDLHLLTS
jgi:hypothetical protein